MGRRETVRLEGFLQGQGQQVRCHVQATRVSHPTAPGVFEYVRFDVLDEERLGLPDGDYDLLIDGRTIRLRRSDGFFLSTEG